MRVSDRSAALVLCSGGQDSTTCLRWAANRWQEVYSVAFDYGQRHRVELDAAHTVASMVGVVEHRVIPVEALKLLAGNSLTGDTAVGNVLEADNGLPNTFVPGRNLMFFTLAAAWAYQLKVSHLVTGVCQTDYSGYPDCRQQTVQAMTMALRTGMDYGFTIHTPLMHLTKAQSVQLAQEEQALELLAYSHTCYNGSVPPCGTCPACKLRERGFREAGIADPLLQRLASEGTV
ncbi:MAG: 7-cyano-7-deazaguanine synthase QueC [Planctomycetota bacterium]|nr:MAG: 7-cyano-7-deazaguanine synthase QueC [Planctomycetota bacterium]